jgi:hypothetical protein
MPHGDARAAAATCSCFQKKTQKKHDQRLSHRPGDYNSRASANNNLTTNTTNPTTKANTTITFKYHLQRKYHSLHLCPQLTRRRPRHAGSCLPHGSSRV